MIYIFIHINVVWEKELGTAEVVTSHSTTNKFCITNQNHVSFFQLNKKVSPYNNVPVYVHKSNNNNDILRKLQQIYRPCKKCDDITKRARSVYSNSVSDIVCISTTFQNMVRHFQCYLDPCSCHCHRFFAIIIVIHYILLVFICDRIILARRT